MPKNNKPQNAGAADPTADDTADKPAHNVINTTPDPVGKPAEDNLPEGGETYEPVMNTTDTEYADEPSSTEKKNDGKIVAEFNKGDAIVGDIADRFGITPEEVFAIVDRVNAARK